MASLSGRLAGIDVGATLCKIAVDGGGERFTVLPSAGLAAVRAHVTAAAPARIVATGGGAGALGEHLAGVAVEVVPALAKGVVLNMPRTELNRMVSERSFRMVNERDQTA
jgi:hypothetical protein